MGEIVVGVEASSASERALDLALDEAGSTGRTLHVLHAHPLPIRLDGISGIGNIDTAYVLDDPGQGQLLAEELLAKALSRRVTQAPVTTHVDARTGDAARQLVSAAQDAALVVVGGSGHGELAGVLLGSVTAYVLHHAQCPVMIVPAGAAERPIRSVVVGIDGSAAARSALLWALDAARRAGCPLVAVYSWQSTTLPHRAPMLSAPTTADFEATAREWLDEELATALPADRAGVDVRVEVVHSTPAWGCLQKAGSDDLLVVGSRGRGGFASLVLGSVATQCAQHATGAVVVVRAGQERL